MKRIFMNKTFINFVATVTIFLIITAIFYAISQCISGSINISIGIN